MKWRVFLISALVIPVSAFAQEIRDDEVIRWSREFAKIYQSSKTWPEFLDKLPHVPAYQRAQLAEFLKDKPLPSLSVVDSFTLKFDSFELKILSVKNRDFRVNGKYVRIPEEARTEGTLKIFHELAAEKSALLRWLERHLVPAANAQINRRLFGTSEALWGDPMRLADACDFCIMAYMYPPVAAGFAADYLVTKAEAMTAKSCDKQMQELESLLREERLGLSAIDCGESYNGKDRSIGFWQPGPNGKPIKREFEFDYRASVLQENAVDDDEEEEEEAEKPPKGLVNISREDPRVNKKATTLYRFGLYGDDSLKEVRTLSENERGKKLRTDMGKKHPQFEKYKKGIESISKIMKYLGKNRTCDKCDKEIEELPVSKAPDYVKDKPIAMPRARPTGGRR